MAKVERDFQQEVEKSGGRRAESREPEEESGGTPFLALRSQLFALRSQKHRAAWIVQAALSPRCVECRAGFVAAILDTRSCRHYILRFLAFFLVPFFADFLAAFFLATNSSSVQEYWQVRFEHERSQKNFTTLPKVNSTSCHTSSGIVAPLGHYLPGTTLAPAITEPTT
jgi:hypothetical protein